MDKSKRNRNAGKHKSYDKRGMSDDAIANKRAYDKEYASKDSAKKKRAECNKKRRQAKADGKNIDGMDYDHSVNRFVKTSTNRGRKEKSRLKKSE